VKITMNDDWIADFRKLGELTIALSVDDRMRYGFTYSYKPVLDDASWRSFASMEEYRGWCKENLPEYLGYGSIDGLDQGTISDLSAALARREIGRRRRLPGYEQL
jgi:hypothetical protein